MLVYTHTHTHTYIHTYIHTYVHTYMHIYIVQTYLHTYVHTHYVYVCVMWCIHVHTYFALYYITLQYMRVQKSRIHLQILGTREVALCQLCTDDPELRSDLWTCPVRVSWYTFWYIREEKLQQFCWLYSAPPYEILWPGVLGTGICAPRKVHQSCRVVMSNLCI